MLGGTRSGALLAPTILTDVPARAPRYAIREMTEERLVLVEPAVPA